MSEFFNHGIDTIEKETKLYGIKKFSHNLVENYLQLSCN
jgi:hypothetical protein